MELIKNVTSIIDGYNVTDNDAIKFTWHDYTLFWLMLVSSAVIGIYFGCFGKKQSTADEYLLGGKEMNVFPIAMSLIASHISAITILAVPADVYKFGITFWIMCFSFSIAIFISTYVYMPVFYKLQLTSTYEYLKLRFDGKIRLVSSFLFTISMLMHLPIVIYLPALALAQGTGINLHFITPLVCGVCIFYTTLGGLKAVVWTDTLQFIIMIGAMAAVLVLGIINAGGVSQIIASSYEGGRLDFDWSFDLTHRDMFWSALIGTIFTWFGAIAIGQGCIQKCLALPTFADVKKAFLIFSIGMIVILSTSVFTGLMLYDNFKDCDPLTTKKVKQADQLMPYYVLIVAGSIPGLPGLFIAGVFSAALSTLSAGLNCLSGTLYEDFVSGYMPHNVTQKKVSNILKLIVVIVGAFSTGCVFLVEKMGGILPLGLSLSGVTTGPLVGLFSMGILIPSANSKGALYGSLTSLFIMTWIIMTSQWYKINHLITDVAKPMSTEGCNYTFLTAIVNNSTSLAFEESSKTEPWYIFRITYYLYNLIGCAIVFIVGLPVSWLTKDPKAVPVSKDLISPVMHWACVNTADTLPKNYYSVEQALHIVKENTKDEFNN